MSRFGSSAGSGSWRESFTDRDLSGLRSEGREPGARRRKLAGYIKAANELRQTYQDSYTQNWKQNTQFEDVDDGTPGAFPDAAVVRTGEEEMILFPSYATKHVKRQPELSRTETRSSDNASIDSGPGDEEYWRQEWQRYEDDHAVVDVDVRGWIYTPFSGMMSRKQRLFVGLARQMVGIPAPPTESSGQTPASSRGPSPHGHRDRLEARAAQKEEEYVAQQAERLVQIGEAEADAAGKGQYSERPRHDQDNDSIISDRGNRTSLHPRWPSHDGGLSHASSQSSLRSNGPTDLTPVQKRASWNQPSNMSQAELREANTHLMTRLRPFMATPMANTPISVFFYNEDISRQRTVTTNAAGHFNVRAALDFVPTHVRVLASEKLSATEPVIITKPHGVSLISDVDDTLKHSAISSGAREIFRNAFIRDLGDLTIDGVREWYTQLADEGVKFHYVSNSPWQLYPVVAKYFAMAGLPPGSFHLKQYSGMLQGIFEPVAERKKGTLDRIAQDFPDRKFILVGDSGEADLEVYTDFAMEHRGRVLAIFIRDVTTPHSEGFFSSSMGALAGNRHNSNLQTSGGGSRGGAAQVSDGEYDSDMKAAIAASLRDMEIEERRRGGSGVAVFEDSLAEDRPKLPPRRPTEPPMENLIEFSDDEASSRMPPRSLGPRQNSDTIAETRALRRTTAAIAPSPPTKPNALRSPSIEVSSGRDGPRRSDMARKAPPPPKPRRPSTSINTAGTSDINASQRTVGTRPPTVPKPSSLSNNYSYTAAAKQKIASAYNNLPSASSYWYGNQTSMSHSQAGPNGALPSSAPPSAQNGYLRGAPPSAQPYSTSSGSGYGGQDAPMSKREQLWYQRWAKAKERLAEDGVTLRSWRIGVDVLDESLRLVRRANAQYESD